MVAWLLTTWASLAAFLPLVILPMLLVPIWQLCHRGALLPPAAQGQLRCGPGRQVRFNDDTLTLRGCQSACAHWFVIVYFEQRASLTVWRDSLSDADYRHLLVVVQRERQAP
ncbi:protein YgfX [Vibrio proteolyticus]